MTFCRFVVGSRRRHRQNCLNLGFQPKGLKNQTVWPVKATKRRGVPYWSQRIVLHTRPTLVDPANAAGLRRHDECGLLARICLRMRLAARNCFNTILPWSLPSVETKDFRCSPRQHYPLLSARISSKSHVALPLSAALSQNTGPASLDIQAHPYGLGHKPPGRARRDLARITPTQPAQASFLLKRKGVGEG